jgi:AAA domain
MVACECIDVHKRRRVVLTGGPGAGKTALLELIRQSFCAHVKVLPEAASVVFGGGFPREDDPTCRRAAQRAIFYVQRELEIAGDSHNPAIVLCDRGTLDGLAYWPGLRRSSGCLCAPPSRPSSVDTTPSSICVRPRRNTATTTRIRCGQSQPAPRPTLTPESCGPGNDIPDGSLSSRPPSSLTRPHGRSTSFAASCPSVVSGTSFPRFATIGQSQ